MHKDKQPAPKNQKPNTPPSVPPSFLAQGTYGCVFRPAYKCPAPGSASTSKGPARKTVPKTVAKVFSKRKNYEDEIDVNDIITNVDPHGAFTLPIKEHCDIPNDMYPLGEMTKCSRHNFNSMNTVPQIVYPDGGLDLSADHTPFEKIFVALEPVFKGLEALKAHKVVHQDIKPDNIVYDASTETCRLIDFGVSIHASNVFTDGNKRFLKHTYPFFPPEYKLQYGILKKNIDLAKFDASSALHAYNPGYPDLHTKKIVEYVHKNNANMYNFLMANYQHAFSFAPEIRHLYDNGIFFHREQDRGMQDTVDLIESAKNKTEVGLYDRIDVHMLGASVLNVLVTKLCINQFDPSNVHFYVGVMHLIADMIRINCHKRLTPKQAYTRYKACKALLAQNKKRTTSSSPSSKRTKPRSRSISTSPSVQIVRTVKGRTPDSSVEIVAVKSAPKRSPSF